MAKSELMKDLLSIILIAIFWGCSHNSSVEKHLSHSGNVMDVKGLVKEIGGTEKFPSRIGTSMEQLY